MKVLFIVLSGGKGTRLRPVTFFRQKTLLPAMNGERIVDFSIKSGMIHGVNGVRESKTIILAKYKSQQVIDYIQRKYPEVSVLLESHSWDTGGAMLQHWKVIQSYNPDVVIVLNGDHFVHLPVQRLLQVYNNKRLALLLVGVKSNETHHDYINMGVGSQDMLCHFCERKSEVAYTGIFLVRFSALNECVSRLAMRKCNMTNDIVKWIYREYGGGYYLMSNEWDDLGTWKRYIRFICNRLNR